MKSDEAENLACHAGILKADGSKRKVFIRGVRTEGKDNESNRVLFSIIDVSDFLNKD
jgi:hypothetical protein